MNYRHLSIDVMMHSVVDFISIIKKYINNIPLVVVTNENKPVLAITPTNTISYNVTNNSNVKSTTGAGDSFIGGFFIKIYN